MLEPIFTAPVQHAVFRAALNAQSYPGRCVPLPTGVEGAPAYRALLSALLDAEVSLADPQNLLCAQADWPFLEARASDAPQADFILLPGDTALTLAPRIGTLEEPEKSATLVWVVGEIGREDATQDALNLQLSGPGIKTPHGIYVSDLHADWLSQRQGWNCAFPMGVDIFLAGSNGILALPRTTKIEVI